MALKLRDKDGTDVQIAMRVVIYDPPLYAKERIIPQAQWVSQ